MGEHEHSSIFTTGILYSGTMRNSRGKLFVYVAVLGTFFIIMFMFSHTHSSLKELEGVSQKCQQQRDSLSAQLQVVYEHKNRLEKSLQQEKSDHTHTREECDTQHREMERKQQQDKEKLQAIEKKHTELKSSYTQLDDDKNVMERKMQDQLLSLEKQKEEEILKLQTQLNDLLEEKDKLQKSHDAYKMKFEDNVGELNICQVYNNHMEAKLKEHMKKLQSPVPVKESHDQLNKALDEHKPETVPKINGETAEISNISVHKDKQVLMRPNVQPPDIRKSPIENSILKYSKDFPDTDVNHGGSVQHNDDVPVKTKVNSESGLNKRDSEPRDQVNNQIISETNDIGGADDNNMQLFHQGLANHPQVQPPHQFDDAAEHREGGMFPQNGMDEQKPQLEQPLNKAHHFSNELRKSSSALGGFLQSNNGLAVPRLQGLMERVPEDNDVHDNHAHHPFEGPQAHLIQREPPLNDRGAVDHADGEDDDDDQEGENDEEQLLGGGPAVRGREFQDNDFEDQDNADNENDAKKPEEGVMVAPK